MARRLWLAVLLGALGIVSVACDPVYDIKVHNRCDHVVGIRLYNNRADATLNREERLGGTTKIRPGATFGVADGGKASALTPTVRVSTLAGPAHLLRAHRTDGESFAVTVRGDACR